MDNHMAPFLPQLQQYQKVVPKPELYSSSGQQPLQMLQQPIPSIVINPLHAGDQQNPPPPSYYHSQGTLPAPDQGRKQAPVVNPMPVLYNQHGQPLQGQMPMHTSRGYPMAYGMNQPPLYFVPQSQVYPQYRPPIVYPENYQPVNHMKTPSEGPHYAPQQTYPMPQHQGNVQMPLLQSIPPPPKQNDFLKNSADPTVLLKSKTHYKPTQTKKNSRPKINKIVSESYDLKSLARKRSRIEVEEPTIDSVYEHFREVLAIPATREEISRGCHLVLEDDLEKKLFELFVEKLAIFIDVFLNHDIFEKIVSELALYDDSRIIMDSMFCLSSLILQRSYPEAIDPLYPLKCYQRTVNSIRFHLSQPEVEKPQSGMLARCLLGTCLLCIYELFFVAVDSTYIKGAGSILMSILSKKNRNESLLKSSPFYETCFWATFTCDLILSMKLEMPNVFSVDTKWRSLENEFFGDLEKYSMFQDDPRTIKDAAANYSSFVVSRRTTICWQHKIMLIYSSINELLHLSDVTSREDFESNKRFYQWQYLRKKLEEYEQNMPIYLKPLVNIPSSEERVFPVLFFKDEHTAIAALHFKLSKLAILELLYLNVRVQDMSLVEAEFPNYPLSNRVKFSKDILGILQTYDSNNRVWPVSVHSLRQASNGIIEGTEEYRQLKILAGRLIKFIHSALQLLVLNDHK